MSKAAEKERAAVERAEAVTDLLSFDKRVKFVADALDRLLEQLFRLHLDHRPDDTLIQIGNLPTGEEVFLEAHDGSGTHPTKPGAKVKTYGDRIRELEVGIADIEENADPAVLEKAKEDLKARKPEPSQNGAG